jgi:hypothetical protein
VIEDFAPRQAEPSPAAPRYLGKDRCFGAMRARTVARRSDMPMLFWLPMIFVSAMFELNAPSNRQAKSDAE